MTEAKYIGRISPILKDDWTDNVPQYYSYYDFHMKRKKAKAKLKKERMLLVLVSAFIVFVCMSISAIRPESRETYENNLKHAVSSGDTLWSIAKEYKKDDVSTAEFVYKIKKTNKLVSSDINVGDLLIIPE